MKILIISQVFWPDTASTAQHLSDIAVELVNYGNSVHVICSKFSYENPSICFERKQIFNNVTIQRLNGTGLGKKNSLRRVIDFLSFNILLSYELIKVKTGQYDMMIGMTSPPMISFIGVFFSKIKKIKFIYWAMDLQPELAIASGMIKKNSISANLLLMMNNYIIKNADRTIALDSFMKKYFINRGAFEKQISVCPVWPVIENLNFPKRTENPFRIEHQFNDKIVVMYSGNHAYVHPLDTLLESIYLLKEDERFLFVFIGEGVRKKEVTEFKKRFELDNIIQLPYQPRNNIHNSLSAADIHVVIMGNGQVGYTHPNKIYGAMFIGKPILYIGPSPSHITEILNSLDGNLSVEHTYSELLSKQLISFANNGIDSWNKIGYQNLMYAEKYYNPNKLKANLANLILS